MFLDLFYGLRDEGVPVDISPDRFVATTDVDGKFRFTDLPNTGKLGVWCTIMPSSFNGFDMESYGPIWRGLDVYVGGGHSGTSDDHFPSEGALEVFLHVNEDAPFLVSNNWEDFNNKGYDIETDITGTFSRTIRLPEDVDVEKAEAKYRNGVLTLRVPRAEAAKPRRIEVQAA